MNVKTQYCKGAKLNNNKRITYYTTRVSRASRGIGKLTTIDPQEVRA